MAQPLVVVRIYLSPTERDELQRRAKDEGAGYSTFVRAHLAPILNGERHNDQISRARLEGHRERLASLHRQRERAQDLLDHVPKGNNVVLNTIRRRLAATVNDLDLEALHVATLIHKLEEDPMPAQPKPRTDTAAFPIVAVLGVAMPTDWGVLGPALVVGAIILGVAIVKRRALLAWAKRRLLVDGDNEALDEAASLVGRGIDKGAPKGAGFRFTRGSMSDEEAIKAYRHNPNFLDLFIQTFLEQDDGLEKLRVFSEDRVLEAAGPDGIENVHLLVATEEQMSLIPREIRIELLSQRGRALLTENTIPHGAVVTVEAGSNGNGHSKAKIEPPAPAAAPEKPKETKKQRSARLSRARKLAEELGQAPETIDGVTKGPDGSFRLGHTTATPDDATNDEGGSK